MPIGRRASEMACALLLWFGAACASHHSGGKAGEQPSGATIPVEIESHHWSDVVIYVLRGSQPDRLGTVTALSTVTFAFPSRFITAGGSVRLTAYPIGGHAFTSDPIQVQPGQMIHWTLESDLTRSSLSVY